MSVLFPERFPSPQLAEELEVQRDPVFDHLVACPKRVEDPGEISWPQCVAVDPTTNHIYVAEGAVCPDFAGVLKFSETGEFLRSFTHEDMESLHGIAIQGENLYLTDWRLHCVFQINIGSDFRLVDRMGSKGSEIGQFDTPSQLSISANGDLYIADSKNDRVQILDSSLHPIRLITHPSMHSPCDVKLKNDYIYVLSDEDNPCVHVFSTTGHKISSFCLSLDSRNNIIISDYRSHQIKIFSNEGTIVQTLGGLGHDIGMLYVPSGLALISNNKLVTVSLNENYRIQIFSTL